MSPASPTKRAAIATLLVLALLLAGCDSTAKRAGTASPSVAPTTTHTPARELLTIDDQPVIKVFVPDPAQDAAYALTSRRLYRRDAGSWHPTNTVNDGRALLVDPANPERLFRGRHPDCTVTHPADRIALEVSHDGGETWQALPEGENIMPLAIDPTIPEIIYGSNCYLAISIDAGRSWMRLALMPDFPVASIAFVGERALLILGKSHSDDSRLRQVDITDPAKPLLGPLLLEIQGRATFDVRGDMMVVGARNTVHVSVDGGQNWTEQEIAPEDGMGTITIHAVRIGPTSKQRIYLGTDRGLFISQDGGATWVSYKEVADDEQVTDIQFSMSAADLLVTTQRGVISVPNP